MDQNSTDLQKSLGHIGLSKANAVLYGSLGGRVDQALSQLHQLYSLMQTDAICDVFLITGDSLVMVLEEGAHQIEAPVCKGGFSKYAGIVPLTGPSNVTTTGFEWNLNGEELEFGKFVSTSNHIVSNEIGIITSAPVILTLNFDLDWDVWSTG